jgi:hypothetical protein
VVECPVQLVNGVWPERVAYLRPVERDPYGAGRHGPVVSDVGEVETLDLLPRGGVEQLGDKGHGPSIWVG